MIENKKYMRTLTIIFDTYFPKKDGVLTYVRSILPLLTKHYNITLIVPTLPNLKKESFNNVETIFAPTVPIELGGYRLAFPNLSSFKAIRNSDVVLIHDLAPLGAISLFITQFLKKQTLFFCHHDENILLLEAFKLRQISFLPHNLFLKVIDKIVSMFYNLTDIIIFATQRYDAKLKRLNVEDKKKKFIPFSVDSKMFSSGNRQTIRQEYGIPEDAKIILYLGRMSHEKNVETIIQAMPEILSKNKDTWFIFVGGGPRINNYKALSKSLCKDRYKFIGEVEWEHVPNILSMADIFVHPSIHESQCFSVMEAMAAGLPVIVPAENGTAFTYLEDEKNCLFLSNPQDVNELVDKINILIKNKKIRKILGANARKKLSEFSWDAHFKKLQSEIEFLIEFGAPIKGNRSRRAKARRYAVLGSVALFIYVLAKGFRNVF
jgi:1,2-diacylglycerol 3-alpha-glucosyltransferase